jgi:transcriptional regulator with XRE-family HTH domain
MRVQKKDISDIPGRLRDIRIENRLTQKEMGKIIGMTSGSVGALENGLYTPNFDVLRILKKRLSISYDYLIDGEKKDGSTQALKNENAALKEEIERLKKVVDKLVK